MPGRGMVGALSRTQAHAVDLVALLTGLTEVQFHCRSLPLGCLWFLGCFGGGHSGLGNGAGLDWDSEKECVNLRMGETHVGIHSLLMSDISGESLCGVIELLGPPPTLQ